MMVELTNDILNTFLLNLQKFPMVSDDNLNNYEKDKNYMNNIATSFYRYLDSQKVNWMNRFKKIEKSHYMILDKCLGDLYSNAKEFVFVEMPNFETSSLEKKKEFLLLKYEKLKNFIKEEVQNIKDAITDLEKNPRN